MVARLQGSDASTPMGYLVTITTGRDSWKTRDCRTPEEAISVAQPYVDAGAEVLIIDAAGQTTTLPRLRATADHTPQCRRLP